MEKYKPTNDSVKKNLSERFNDKFIKEIDLFLCNTSLDKSDQEKLIRIINKIID